MNTPAERETRTICETQEAHLTGHDGNCIFCHIKTTCEHDLQGWRNLKDSQGRIQGGERICTKCGEGAMSISMREGL